MSIKKVIGTILLILGIGGVIAGIAYGLYFWIGVCLIGSIANVINECQKEVIDGMVIAISVIKFLWAMVWGILVGLVSCIPGAISCVAGFILMKD